MRNPATRAALLAVDVGVGLLASRPLAARAPAGRALADRALQGRERGRAIRVRVQRDAAARLNGLLPSLLDACLDRIDVTALVLRRVDLDELARRLDVEGLVRRVDVNEVARRLDLAEIVDREDLIALARDVVDGIDLPQIIRDSTGSVASEGLQNVRLRSAQADDVLAGAVDRLLRRSTRRSTRRDGARTPPGEVPAPPGGVPADEGHGRS